jgi:phosphoribosylamine--glycine ligase
VKILVVGNGAREDALSWRLSRSESCSELFAAPGNAGTASRGTNWAIPATDGKSLLARALEEKIDLVVVGPETAIAAGVCDRFREARIPTFGPNRAAGRLESSKIFAKRFMERHGIPTAKARVVHSFAHAVKALADWRGGCVVKADGLAAGKGVVVSPDAESALAVLRDWYGSGGVPGGGSDVLLEEKLEGREVSVFAVGDGKRFVTVGAACDYKRAGDGDTGPNTGGMGAYSPPAGFPVDLQEIVRERVLDRVVAGLDAENERFVGVLYCGLMWTAAGPSVIEFNVRFGDPETQVLMPRVRGDFARLLRGAAEGARDGGLSAHEYAAARSRFGSLARRGKRRVLGSVERARRRRRCGRGTRAHGNRPRIGSRARPQQRVSRGRCARAPHGRGRLAQLPQRYRGKFGVVAEGGSRFENLSFG